MFRTKIKQIITILLVSLLITACQSTSNGNQEQKETEVIKTEKDPRKGECKYIQRNLTISWDKRSYWCVPK